MKKGSLLKLKKTLIVVGILTLSVLGMAGCSKKSAPVETTTTAVETVEVDKDFSIELTPEEQSEADEFRNSDLLHSSESIADDGEVVYNESMPDREEEEKLYTEDTIKDIRTEWYGGDLSTEELKDLINTILIYSSQEEKDSLYEELVNSKEANEAVEKQESKPAETTPVKSKPVETKKAQEPTVSQKEVTPTQVPETTAPVQPEPAPTQPAVEQPAPTQPQIVETEAEVVVDDLPNGVYYLDVPGVGTIRSDDPRASAYAGGGRSGSDDLSPEDKAREDAIVWQ